MKMKLLSLILAVIISSATVAFAVEVDLIFNNQVTAVIFDRTKFFEKKISVNNNTVHISISGRNNYTLSSILVFLCRDKEPDKCDFSNPIEYERFVETDFRLDDISANSKANILSLVKVDQSWLGSWDVIENSAWKTSEIDKFTVYLKHDAAKDVKNLVENFGSIPTGSIEKIDFQGKAVYVLEGKKSSGLFKKEKIDIVSSILSGQVNPKKGYTFVLPRDSQIYNPLTFFNTPELCGNLRCDAGETYNTCWQDCACPDDLVNTPHGCVPKTNLGLVIENINKKEFSCFIPPDIQAFKTVGGCVFTDDIEIKLSINNTPTTYTLNPPYFYLGGETYPVASRGTCTPDLGEGYEIVENNFTTAPTIVYNASKFTCNLYFPPLNRQDEFKEKLAFSIIFPITTQKGNETETHELVGTTGIDIIGTSLKIDLTELQDLARKLDDLAKKGDKLKKISDAISTAELLSEAVKSVTDGCCASVIGSAYCCGVTTWWTVLVILVHAANYKLKEYIEDCYEGKSSPWGHVTDDCDKIAKLKNNALRKILESAQETRTQIAQGIPNLVWVNGNKSGPYTPTVCGQESVEVWYNFESFGCSERDGLWFNFNNQTRPECDCQRFQWIGNEIEIPFCDCSKVSQDFSWDIKNQGGKDIGRRIYNPKGKHLLLNTTADRLFQKRNILNITAFCSTGVPSNVYGFELGGGIGDVLAEWELVNYTATCA